MSRLTMGEVADLWEQDRPIPLELAPIALWHLFEPLLPIDDRPLPYSEEALGLEF